MSRLSAKQRTALEAVAAGRVTYGEPFPEMLARRVARAQREAAAGKTIATSLTGRGPRRPVVTNPLALANQVMMLDGHEVYGAEHSTYASLSDRGLILAYPNNDGTARVVTLTDAGRAALGQQGRAAHDHRQAEGEL